MKEAAENWLKENQFIGIDGFRLVQEGVKDHHRLVADVMEEYAEYYQRNNVEAVTDDTTMGELMNFYAVSGNGFDFSTKLNDVVKALKLKE
jgi:hypothetical protein